MAFLLLHIFREDSLQGVHCHRRVGHQPRPPALQSQGGNHPRVGGARWKPKSSECGGGASKAGAMHGGVC
eukprot:11482444-Alexandrium_andersonii.AAC.1